MTSKILVADDSPTIQKIVALAFENEDIQVRGAGSGQEAWQLIEEYQPDIVLADVDMPGMSGFELCRKIKSSTKHQGRWVILLTSDFEEFDEEGFQSCAAEDHLSKPFKTEDIIKKVQGMLTGDGVPNALDIVEEESAPAMELSADDMEDDSAPVVELSADNITEDEPGEFELSADDLIDELLEDKPADPTLEADGEEAEPSPETAEEEDESEDTGEEGPEDGETPQVVAEEPEEVELTLDDMALPDDDEPEAESEPEPTEAPAQEPAAAANDDLADESESDYTYLLTDAQIFEFDESRVPDETVPEESEAPAARTETEPEDETVPEESEAPAARTETEPEEEIEEPMEPLTEMENDDASPDLILGEMRQDPDPVEDLEDAFRAVTKSKKEPTPEETEAPPKKAVPEKADTPDLIQESRAFLAEKTGKDLSAPEKPARLVPPALTEENLSEAMVQHAARVLEAGLERNLKKELAGISDQVDRVVREVVQEMAPDIIREVIRKEIQEIRKMEEV